MNGFEFKSYLKKVEKEMRAANSKLVTQAANVVLREVKRILNNPTGDAPQSITGNLKAGVQKEKKGLTARIGVKAPRGQVERGKRTAAHAWLVEHGHDIIASQGPKKGQKIGEAKPHPFLSTAFENTKEQVKAILSERRD